MSFVKQLQDDLNHDPSGDEPRYGEDIYDDGPWPSPNEETDDMEQE